MQSLAGAVRFGASTRFISCSSQLRMPQEKDGSEYTQKDMEENQRKLEQLEKKQKSIESDLQRPSREELKKKGDDAQVEQHRPDDGVY